MLLNNIIDNVSRKDIVIGILGFFVVYISVKWISEERKIRSLGGHAPKIGTYLPFGSS